MLQLLQVLIDLHRQTIAYDGFENVLRKFIHDNDYYTKTNKNTMYLNT